MAKKGDFAIVRWFRQCGRSEYFRAIVLTIGWAIEGLAGEGAIGLFRLLALVLGIAWWLFCWNYDGHTEHSILSASNASAPGVPRREPGSEFDEWEA